LSVGLIIGLAVVSVVAIAAVVLVLRTRSSVESRVRDLADGLGYSAELAASLDPADVLDRTLDAAVSLPGVDAALVVLGTDPDQRTAAGTGLSEEEISRISFQMPAHPDLASIAVAYHYRLDDVEASSRLPRTALTLALRSNGDTVGSLAAISRSSEAPLPPATVEALDALARRAGPAIANARRFAEAREQAELDSLTGLHNRRLFYEFLGREIARAQRYERFVSLIVIDLDDFKRINDRIGHLGGDAVLAEVAQRIRGVVRSTDIPCRVGGDEFAVILPESSREDAELLADRIGVAIRSQKIEKVGVLKISAGVAELRQDDTAAELFKRADHALYRAKHAGKARTVAQ
jgi:diguanylate cyclase (GGDEF)-like protein